MEIQAVVDEQVPLLKLNQPVEDVEFGALAQGGALPLGSAEAMGIFAQFAAVGFLFTLLPALNYPIFNVYLQMEGYQTTSYTMLVAMGWSFKVFFGMLSDCVRVLGYRRKSWMLFGWSLCLVCLAAMANLSFGAPYCDRTKTTYCRTPLVNVPASELQHFNVDAPNQGSIFIVLSIIVSIGYVVAECAADAMIIEYGQREPAAYRGRFQTIAFATRYLFGLPALLVTGLGLNGVQYNGTFSFALAPNVPYAFCLIPCAGAFLATIFLVVEAPAAISTSKSVAAWWRRFWGLVQSQVLWQVCAVKFCNGILRGFAATPLNPIKTAWANVEPATDSLSSLVGTLLFSGALLIVSRYGLQWDWRWGLAITNVAILVLDALAIFATTWGVVRNQYFFAFVTMTEQIPNAMAIMIGGFCVVEVADVGTEGTVYGLIASLGNLTVPLSAVVYKYVDSFFHVNQDDIKSDTTTVRWDVTTVYLISYACKLLALMPLLWLPAQKAQIQALKQNGTKSSAAGAAVLITCGCAIAFSVISNSLAIFPSTKCFRLAGGNGKVNKTGWCT